MRLRLRATTTPPTVLDLGGGYTLVGTQHHLIKEGINEWRLRGPKADVEYGYVDVDFYPDIPYPSIHTITVNPQRQGYGSKIIRAVVDYYGGLTSDPQAFTTDAAVALWKSLGAEKIPTNKNTKGYYYQLVKK